MCGAPDQAVALPPNTDLSKETVLAGRVLAGGQPVGGAFVRLLDGTGEFTAEVVTSATGAFRFFAAPGDWTLRTLAPGTSPVDTVVTAQQGVVAEAVVEVPA